MKPGGRSGSYYLSFIFQAKEFKGHCIGQEVIAKIFQKTNMWSDFYLWKIIHGDDKLEWGKLMVDAGMETIVIAQVSADETWAQAGRAEWSMHLEKQRNRQAGYKYGVSSQVVSPASSTFPGTLFVPI